LTKTPNAKESSIDVSPLAAGTYLVKIVTDDVLKTMKVIKE